MIVIVTGIPSLYLVPSVRQFRYWSLGGGGDCHCNRYTKPVTGVICEAVQVLVSGWGVIVIVTGIPSQYLVPSVRQFRYWSLGGGGDCHCNRYTNPVPGAICETVQVLDSEGGGVIVIVTGIPSLYLVPSVRQFRYWSLGGG